MSSPPQPPSLPLPLPPTSVHNQQPPPQLLPSLQFVTHPGTQNQLQLHVHLPSSPTIGATNVSYILYPSTI